MRTHYNQGCEILEGLNIKDFETNNLRRSNTKEYTISISCALVDS